MDLIPEHQLDNSLALDNNIKGHCNPDIAKVLLNHARQSKTQIILNEFTKTTGKTASLTRVIRC